LAGLGHRKIIQSDVADYFAVDHDANALKP
jgi:hypothetical protein